MRAMPVRPCSTSSMVTRGAPPGLRGHGSGRRRGLVRLARGAGTRPGRTGSGRRWSPGRRPGRRDGARAGTGVRAGWPGSTVAGTAGGSGSRRWARGGTPATPRGGRRRHGTPPPRHRRRGRPPCTAAGRSGAIRTAGGPAASPPATTVRPPGDRAPPSRAPARDPARGRPSRADALPAPGGPRRAQTAWAECTERL